MEEREGVSSHVRDRLVANLRAAAIPWTDGDLAAMEEFGFLSAAAALEELLERVPPDGVPDYLAAWGGADGFEAEEQGAAASGVNARWIAPLRASVNLSTSADAPPPRTPLPPAPGGYRSIEEVAARLRAREVSPVELTEDAVRRIAEQDAHLNAFQLVLGERALADARTAEAEIAGGLYRGPLHGVPVAAKDLLYMEGTPTSAGSRVLLGHEAPGDAAAIERLREAGAVIVGKARMSELAYSPGSNNPHYGPTRNPWNSDHDTGGSSSGSGAAVAAGLVYAALGTDTGGSVRIPASLCGVVGLKPTYGRTSLWGAVPLSWSLDHLGPLARTVGDAALLLTVLAGHDPRDPRTRRDVPPPERGDLEAGVAGLRVGVLGDDGSGTPLSTPEALAAWREGLGALEGAGAELVELPLPEMRGLLTLAGVVLSIEAATLHERFLRERPGELGAFVRPRLLAAYAHKPGTFIRAQQARAALRSKLHALWHQVDLLSTPGQPGPAPLLGVPASTRFTAPFNLLGWPAVSVPVGLAPGRLPVGLQLVGRPWDEATVLRAARVVESDGPWVGILGGEAQM